MRKDILYVELPKKWKVEEFISPISEKNYDSFIDFLEWDVSAEELQNTILEEFVPLFEWSDDEEEVN